ncbi:MAG: hypothetical protein AB1730_06745 [Myxococcota bacterium]
MRQGFLSRLVDFDWDAPVPPAPRLPRVATAAARVALQGMARLFR